MMAFCHLRTAIYQRGESQMLYHITHLINTMMDAMKKYSIWMNIPERDANALVIVRDKIQHKENSYSKMNNR